MSPHVTGGYVRYLDHIQALATEKALYVKAKEQTELVREQLRHIADLKNNYHSQATKMELDNVRLRKQINKLECIVPLVMTVVALLTSTGTYFLAH